MSNYFKDKVAFVTGAGSGIGASVARRLGTLGSRVAVSDRNEATAREVADAIVAAGGTALAIGLDVTDHAAVERAVLLTEERFGGLHLAVNNAGGGGHGLPLVDYPIEGWEQIVGVNLHGVFYSLKYELGAMLRSGGGAIVNLASVLGTLGERGSSAYVAAKHGVVGLTKTAALDYAKQGIRVNAVCPGYIDTPLLKGLEGERRQAFIDKHPMGRFGQAEEVTDLIIFLLSDKASFITGSHHLVDGALTAV